jgi:hypothetical protein
MGRLGRPTHWDLHEYQRSDVCFGGREYISWYRNFHPPHPARLEVAYWSSQENRCRKYLRCRVLVGAVLPNTTAPCWYSHSVTACSAVRLTTLVKWAKSGDPTYDYSNVAIWSLIETMAAVICACMPGMAGLMRRIFARKFKSVESTPDFGSMKGYP